MRLSVKDLSFAYPGNGKVLSDISFSLDEGRILSILGPNGAGKTTLLQCLLGFLKTPEGKILYNGTPLNRISERLFWQKTAYVPQAKTVSFPYTVKETVLLGRSAYLGLFQSPGEEDIRYAEQAMEQAGITHLAEKTTAEISGGEFQLTLIARALAAQPELLVLDEPETGLDFRNQLVVIQLIKKLNKQKHLSIIFNTHYPEHAYDVADRTLLIKKDGHAETGDTTEVLSEKSMQDAFDVKLKITRESIEGRCCTSIRTLGLR